MKKEIDAKKITSVIESVNEDVMVEGTSSHKWNGYDLVVSGDDEFIEKAHHDAVALREELRNFINNISIVFPHGPINGDKSFELKFQSKMGPVIMEPIKQAFDSCVEKYEYLK